MDKNATKSYEFWLFKVLPWAMYICAIGYAFIMYMMGKGDMNTVRVVVFVMLASRVLEPVKVLIAGIKSGKKNFVVRACVALAVVLVLAGAEWFILNKAEEVGLEAKSLNSQVETAATTEKKAALQKLVSDKSSEFIKWLVAAGVVFVIQIFNEIALPDLRKKKPALANPEEVEVTEVKTVAGENTDDSVSDGNDGNEK